MLPSLHKSAQSPTDMSTFLYWLNQISVARIDETVLRRIRKPGFLVLNLTLFDAWGE
jgi:hypothetical protein